MVAYGRYFFRVTVFTIAMAAGLEMLQRYAVDRHAGATDAVVKASGAVVGIMTARLGVSIILARFGGDGPAE